MTTRQAVIKRAFDVVVALAGLILLGWLILLTYVAASIDTRSSGFFRQERVGRHGRIFRVIKLKTMRDCGSQTTTVTTINDPRITRLGRWFRHHKLDELPQLINVLRGDMSLVGPRPDVQGFADELRGEERLILSVRPGITGPATLQFANEERMLADCSDPERYNLEVIFPEKVRLNLQYVRHYRFIDDLRIIWKTLTHR